MAFLQGNITAHLSCVYNVCLPSPITTATTLYSLWTITETLLGSLFKFRTVI